MNNEHNYRGYNITIVPDPEAINPREFDNLGTMICYHGKYKLGDDHNVDIRTFNNWYEVGKYIVKSKRSKVILPIFMLDHSGLSFRTHSFNDRWDSGQVGFIYATMARINKFFGKAKTLDDTISHISKTIDRFTTELENYQAYINGDCYGFNISKQGKSRDTILFNTCGYYNYSEALKEAMIVIDSGDLKEPMI